MVSDSETPLKIVNFLKTLSNGSKLENAAQLYQYGQGKRAKTELFESAYVTTAIIISVAISSQKRVSVDSETIRKR